MLKYTEIDQLLANFVSMREEYENGEQRSAIGVFVTKGKKVKQRSRLCGAGRKLPSAKLEEVLMEWIESRRFRGLRVSSKLIMKKAQVTFNDMNQNDVTDDDFKASRGWLANFMKRRFIIEKKNLCCSARSRKNDK